VSDLLTVFGMELVSLKNTMLLHRPAQI